MKYSFSVFLVPKVSNRESAADAAIEFVKVDNASPEELDRLGKLNVLEPISNSFEQHGNGSQLDEAEEIVGVILPSNEQTALPLQPGKEAFDDPAAGVASKRPTVLGLELAIAPVRRDQFDALFGKRGVQLVAIVGAVTDQVVGFGLDHVEIEAQLHQRDLVMVGGMGAH